MNDTKNDTLKIGLPGFELILSKDMPEDEQYVRGEATAWMAETVFLSYWVENEHFDRIVNMGCKATPYVVNILKENKNYSHLVEFFSRVYPDLVTFEGYVPFDFVRKVWLELYDSGELGCEKCAKEGKKKKKCGIFAKRIRKKNGKNKN